jgi:hypothetical protein
VDAHARFRYWVDDAALLGRRLHCHGDLLERALTEAGGVRTGGPRPEGFQHTIDPKASTTLASSRSQQHHSMLTLLLLPTLAGMVHTSRTLADMPYKHRLLSAWMPTPAPTRSRSFPPNACTSHTLPPVPFQTPSAIPLPHSAHVVARHTHLAP